MITKRKGVIVLIILIVAALLISSGCWLANQAPNISGLTADKELIETADSCRLECTASDPDGDELSYRWTTDSGRIDGEGSSVSWTAPETPGSYTITVAVSDGRGGEATKQLTLAVVAVNHPPVIESLIVTAEHKYLAEITVGFTSEIGYKVLEGEDYKIECVASDPDGDELLFEWSADGGEWWGEGAMVTWYAPPDSGVPDSSEVSLMVTVSDGRSSVATESVVFVVTTCTCAFPPEETQDSE